MTSICSRKRIHLYEGGLGILGKNTDFLSEKIMMEV